MLFRHALRAGLCAAAALVIAVTAARAEVPMDGVFVANNACPALLSIRKGTNPDLTITGPGLRYKLLAKNQPKPSHYRIDVPGAEPPERWVAASCGHVEEPEAAATAPAPKKPAPAASPAFVLAISWQPAFCEARSRKPECLFQTQTRFDGSHFTLHGLWPQPSTKEYCGVSPAERDAAKSGRWQKLPKLDLSQRLAAELKEVMPGTQSHLDRYEWIKHGTCYPERDPETYYRDSLRLLAAVNGSAVRDLAARNIGREVRSADIRRAFDKAFGPGAGERVRVACRDDGARRLITELTIGLKGDISAGTKVSDLIMASAPTDPGCPSGVIDPAGLQ
jgi:ribonuclease T2